MSTKAGAIGGIIVTTRRAALLDRYFYFSMSLLIAVVVVYGFSHTVEKNFIHPALSRPWILYLHAAVFSGWVLFFILQSTLIRSHNVGLHRKVGWFGVVLGIAVPFLGISTAVTMARLNARHLNATAVKAFLIIPFFDMIAFTIPFVLAIYWRKRSEFHRRLLLIASCALTAAAFGRFPPHLLPPVVFYSGVDLLILLGVVRDVIVNRRIHPVYLYGLPAFILCQTFVMYTSIHQLPYWLKIANAMVS